MNGNAVALAEPGPLRLLGVKAVAKEHSCGERTVWRMIDEGKLPAVRFRRCTRVRESDVLDYIRRCQKGEAV